MAGKITILVMCFFSMQLQASKMIYGETSRIDRYDPYTIHEMAGHRLSDLIFDGLISLDVSGSYHPELAEKWEVLPGNTKVKVFLRKNVVWHNQENFTARDVVKTMQVIKHTKSEIPNRDRFDRVKSIVELDSYTVEIEFYQALSDPLKFLTFKIIPSSSFLNDKFITKNHRFSQHPIGTGPYVFQSSNHQGEVLLHANEEYYTSPPNIKKILLKSYNDQHMMTQSLMFSALDLVTWVSPNDLPEVINDQNLNIAPYDSLEFSFIGINQNKPYFQNKEIRNALNQAIHKEEMLLSFFQNRGQIVSGPFAPNSWAYNINVPSMRWNPEKSRNVFVKHGLNRKRLKFVVPLSGKSDLTRKVVLACQTYLKKSGLNIDLVFLDWVQWKEQVLYKRDYDLAIATWNFDDANNIKSLFHSSHDKKGGYNFVGFSDSQIDSLLTESSLTSDFDKRRAIYHKLHALLSEKSPYIWLWTLQNHAAHRNELSGIKIEPFSFFKNIMSWKKQSQNNI
ncbi:MAG: ABC transporter substrate-binding protein [Oligoflexales bacterium]